jgi:hypothetical protein
MQGLAVQGDERRDALGSRRRLLHPASVAHDESQASLGTGVHAHDAVRSPERRHESRARRGASGSRSFGWKNRPAAAPSRATALRSYPLPVRRASDRSSISVFRFSLRVPKIACMPSPTAITPAAPSALRRSGRVFVTSASLTRRRVMHASRLTRFERPPTARLVCPT